MVATTISPSDENPWRKGMEVEVTSDEEAYTGIWFEATIVKPPPHPPSPPPPPPPSSRRRNSKEQVKKHIALIQYKTLAQSEAAKKRKRFLQEYIESCFLRPVPPIDDSNRSETYVFAVNDVVDAYYLDGWWVGVVSEALLLHDSNPSSKKYKYRYVVDIQNPPDRLEFDSSNLRLHLDWVNGQWFKPVNQSPLLLEFTTPEQLGHSHNPTNSAMEGIQLISSAIEGIQFISSDSGTLNDKTKDRQKDATTFLAHVSTNKTVNQTTGSSDSIISHPSKRSKKGDSPEYNGKEKIEITPEQTGMWSQTVDAIKEKVRPPPGFVQHSPASVESMQTNAGGDNDQPVLKSKISKKNQSYGENVLQMPSKDCGTPLKTLVVCQKSNVADTVAAKCKSDGAQLPISTHVIDQQKGWGTTGKKKRRGRKSQLHVKRKKCSLIGSRNASVGNIDCASGKDHKMENDNMTLTEIYDQPLRILCSEGGILNQLNRVKETHIKLSQHNQELPFTKRCPLWEMFDSKRELQTMEQFPHFNDLHNFEEHCREGLAIGKIVIYKSLVNDRPNLKLDDPQLLWDNYLKVLLDLELNGFDVQELMARFEDMVTLKDRQQRNKDELRKCEIQLLEEKNKKIKVDEDMEELNEEFMKIQEKRAAMMSIKEIQDSKTTSSQLATNELLKDIRSTQLDFERVIATPLLT